MFGIGGVPDYAAILAPELLRHDRHRCFRLAPAERNTSLWLHGKRRGGYALPMKTPRLASANTLAVRTIASRMGLAVRGGNTRGTVLLFSGADGAQAAQALASELKRDLYRVDLRWVVSKYIGETEKNLGKLFDAAGEGSVLLFEEADALFGKRSEVKDAHDRYSNVDVALLLQQLERYGGLVVLASQTVRPLSPALERRMRRFRFPPG